MPSSRAAVRLRPLFSPTGRPMRVAVFSSRGPGNLQATLDAGRAAPDRIEVCLVVADRTGIPALDLARDLKIPVVYRAFDKQTAHLTGRARQAASDRLHAEILEEIRTFESRSRPIDLCVLAYRRVIRGALFEYFRDRMINQHPADLSLFDIEHRRRRYTGIGGLGRSLADGAPATRTSTILATEQVDGGEILVQGPPLEVRSRGGAEELEAHETMQKRVSDWPALEAALHLIAEGRLSVGPPTWSDGCRTVYLDRRPLPYAGIGLEGGREPSPPPALREAGR